MGIIKQGILGGFSGKVANVVGTSVAAKNGYMIGWGKYCRTAVPATIIVVLISMVCIFVRYC